MMERIAETSPRFKARIAGVLSVLSLLAAVFGEFIVRRLEFAGDLIALSGMVAVTLLLYDIFKPVNRSLSLLAAFNLVDSPLGLFEGILGAWTSSWYLADSLAS
jgi:heme A synthase